VREKGRRKAREKWGRVSLLGLRSGFGELAEVLGILELHQFLEDRLIEFPAQGFLLCAHLGLDDEVGNIGESAGAVRGDAIGGESFKELAEDVIDVHLKDEIAAGAGEEGGEVVFARLGFAAATVSEAVAFTFGMAGEATHAPIGESELAKIVGGSVSRAHGERMAKRY
jgi:hypothetical protein